MKRKIKFVKNAEEGFIEIRLYDSLSRSSSYLSWKIPLSAIEELIKWWKEKKQSKLNYNKKEKRGQTQFFIYPDGSVEVKELDNLGRPKLVGWHLPKSVVDELNKRWEIEK